MPTTRRDVLRLGVAAAGLGLTGRRAGLRRSRTKAAARCHAEALAALAWLQPPQQVHGRRPEAVRRARLRRHRRARVSTSCVCRLITAAGPMPPTPQTLKEPVLKEIDQAVEFGKKHGVHVQINFHRAPGFTVAKPAEPKSIWSDPDILDVCAAHWSAFAERYRGRPNNEVSFNLFNEPDDKVKPEDHRRVVERVAGAIRERDPKRLIVCDGRAWATQPPTELLGPRRGGVHFTTTTRCR